MAKETNNCAVTKKFNVHEKMVRMPRKNFMKKNGCKSVIVYWLEFKNTVDEWII